MTQRLQFRFSAFCVLCLFGGPQCFADIVWTSTQQTFHLTTTDKSVTAHYDFVNQGNRAVSITTVKASCSCTTAKLARKTYEPNEKGVLSVTYSVGDQMGLQAKSVAVGTDDVHQPTYILFLYIDIPEPIKFSTRYVVWSVNDKPEPQIINVSAPLEPVKILSVTSDSKNICATLRSQRVGREYVIIVTPVDTKEEARGTLTIETDLQRDGHNRRFYIYSDITSKGSG